MSGVERMQAVVDKRKMNWIGKPVHVNLTRQRKRAIKREEAKKLRSELNPSRKEGEKERDWRSFYI